MRETAGFPGNRLSGILVAVILAGTTGACGSSTSDSAGPPSSDVVGVTCSNYVIHDNGPYEDEVSVRVEVHNSTSSTARYAIDVEMVSSEPGRGAALPGRVTIDGSVTSHSSVELGHKVLTSRPVSRCRVTQVSRT